MAIPEVARRFIVSTPTVRDSCYEHGVKIRRAPKAEHAILERIRKGEAPQDIADDLQIGLAYVQQTASQNGEFVSLARWKNDSTLRIVAMLQDGKRQVEAAEVLGFSRQAVEQVQRRAEKAGIKFPSGSGGREAPDG